MSVNKVVYGTTVLVDLTNDTVTSDSLLQGYKAHGSDGNIVNGSVVVQNYYTGSTEPSDSLGNDGDIYFMKG